MAAMNEETMRFYPPRKRGMWFHIGAMALLAALSGGLLSLALKAALGLGFLLYMLGALSLAVPILPLAYRLFALMRSSYEISREGVRLQWGLRVEDLPVGAIEWVETMDNLEGELILPRLHWPGSLIGTVPHGEGGKVEFMAAEAGNPVMINAGDTVYAITPEERQQFVALYREKAELGSLAPMRPYSAYPTFTFIDIWRLPAARAMLTVTLVLSLTLFVWVGLAVTRIPEVSLGFSPEGIPLEPVSSGQLFLLPVVNLLLLAVSYALAMAFYRRDKEHPLLYVLIGNGTFTAFLFLAAVYFILQGG